MTKPHRQKYGLGSFVKKFTRPIKKVLKSPLAKAALMAGLGSLGGSFMGTGTGTGWGRLNPKNLMALARGAGGLFKEGSLLAPLVRNKEGAFSLGRAGLTGLGLAAVGTPLWQKMMKTGPYEEIEEETEDWDIQPQSMANLLARSKDYYQN